jgi:Tfp pilus assembly protein PilN
MALRDVNLVPADLLHRHHLARHLRFWTCCLIGSLALIWGLYFYQIHVVLAKKATASRLDEMHTELGAKIEEIKRVQRELELFGEQQSVIDMITGNQSYSQVLLKLAKIMNDNTWLTQLAMDNRSDEENEASLKLTGLSSSNVELGNFISELSNDPAVQAVVLKHAKEIEMSEPNKKAAGSVKLIDFHIECSVSSI